MMPDAPSPPAGLIDAQITDRRLAVTIRGPTGAIRGEMSEADTLAVFRMMKRLLEPGRFDGDG